MARTLCSLAFVTAITLLCLGCGNKSAPPPAEGPVPTPKAESEQQQARDVDRTPKQDIDLIQGAWIVESAEFNGEKAGPEVKKEISFVFKGDKMIIKERGQPHSEPFKLDPTKKPKTIDMWHSEDNPKDVTPGIYELEGDRLTICFVDKRGGIRPTVFESKKGSDVSLWALKRDKNAAPSIEEKEPNIGSFRRPLSASGLLFREKLRSGSSSATRNSPRMDVFFSRNAPRRKSLSSDTSIDSIKMYLC